MRLRLDSKLLYTAAQQLDSRRAGTPGRAPRNWQAVVTTWRPLRFFVGFLLLCITNSAFGQSTFPTHTSVQLRIGAFYATPLIKDLVSSQAVDDSIPGTRAQEITLQQKLAPIATIAVRFPMRAKTLLELNASVARTKVRGQDEYQTWDAATTTVANLVLGFAYLYRNAIGVHAGVGMTRLFADETGVFTTGNSIKPVIEGGLSGGFRAGGRPIEIDARVQSHSFGTTTLRDNGGSDGNVLRAILQIGTTLWEGGK